MLSSSSLYSSIRASRALSRTKAEQEKLESLCVHNEHTLAWRNQPCVNERWIMCATPDTIVPLPIDTSQIENPTSESFSPASIAISNLSSSDDFNPELFGSPSQNHRRSPILLHSTITAVEPQSTHRRQHTYHSSKPIIPLRYHNTDNPEFSGT